MAEPLHSPPKERLLAFPESAGLEFPGCRAVGIPHDRNSDHGGRFEYWDADTEVAMVVREPTTTWHEHLSQRLRDLVTLISVARGSPIETFGSADLAVLGPKGDPRRILQADQSLCLRPFERSPGRIVEVGEDALPGGRDAPSYCRADLEHAGRFRAVCVGGAISRGRGRFHRSGDEGGAHLPGRGDFFQLLEGRASP